MKTPKTMTEAEVLQTINKIANILAPRFRFGRHEISDMKQQARVFAIEGLELYDDTRPLENFLWTHVRNRLHNFKRDGYTRLDKPCYNCKYDAYIHETDECSLCDTMMTCPIYYKWFCRNEAKKNLIEPITLTHVHDENEDRMKVFNEADEDLFNAELKCVLDRELPILLRADYLRMLSGVSVPKVRRDQIQETIIEILGEHGYTEEDW